jgi:hypothetical protein
MKQVATLFVLACSACATPVGAVRDAIGEAPDWWREAREEIRGQDYPNLADIPTPTRADQPKLSGGASAAAISAREAAFLRDPRTAGPALTPAQIEAWATGMRARFGDIRPPAPGDFVPLPLDAFDVPRAQLTLKLPKKG